MNTLLKSICCVGLLSFSIIVLGQETTFLQQANDCFKQGDYECAIKNYRKAKALENQQVDAQVSNAEDCLTAFNKGNDAFFEENYTQAKENYQRVLQINPDDANAKKRLELVKKKQPQPERMPDAIIRTTTIRQDVRSKTENDKGYVELRVARIAVQTNNVGGNSRWENANSLCKNSIVGGYTDWRLPTKDELVTIVMNKSIIGIGPSAYFTFWSSTRVQTDKKKDRKDNYGNFYYYTVDTNGNIHSYRAANYSERCRCVRTIY